MIKNNIYRKRLVLLMLIISILLLDCSRTNNSTYNIYISEPIINRDDSNYDTHDNYCKGFVCNQFNIKLIDTTLFKYETINLLKKITHLNWRAYAINDSIININKILSSNEDDTNRVVYIIEIIESRLEEDKILSIGSDDGFKLWVNGDSVATSHKGRQLLPNDDFVRINLKKGKNILIYKIDQGTGDWAIYRKIISNNQVKNIIESQVPEIYSDLPESCIFQDTCTGIFLKSQSRRYFDKYNMITLKWKNINTLRTLNSNNYLPSELPNFIKFPNNADRIMLLEVEVKNDQRIIIFNEIYFLLFEREIQDLTKIFSQKFKNIKDPIYQSRYQSFIWLFNLNHKNIYEYSTCMKAQVLYDLFKNNIKDSNDDGFYYQTAQIWGYKSEKDNSIQPFRIFLPYNLNKAKNQLPVVFILRWFAEKERDNNYWTSQQFQSHWRTVNRASFCNYYKTLIIMPFGRGFNNYFGNALDEIPIIYKQINSYLKINNRKIGLFAHSDASMIALELLLSQKLPITHIGLWSPILPQDISRAFIIATNLKKDYPNLKITIWQGVEDERASVIVTRRWVELFKSMSFEVEYYEQPHSSHFVYLGNPEKEFIRIISK
jgi:hypothetical protein